MEWGIAAAEYNISMYMIEYYAGDGGFAVISNVTSGVSKTFQLTDVVLGQSYSVAVRSVSNVGDAPASFSGFSNRSLQQRTGICCCHTMYCSVIVKSKFTRFQQFGIFVCFYWPEYIINTA